jgi:hypothetical protein
MQPTTVSGILAGEIYSTLNSLSGISLNATGYRQNINYVARFLALSQFPFWDFFECNMPTVNQASYINEFNSLNSLSGISLNATVM